MNEIETGEKANKSFWNTTIGNITKITALLTAVTGLILTIKPFLKSDHTNNVSEEKHPRDTIVSELPVNVDYNSVATDLANDWCKNLKNKNVDELVLSSSLPFYADSKILTSLPEVRESYNSMTANFNVQLPGNDSIHMSAEQEQKLVELKIYKVSELRNKGYDVNGDRIIRSLNLEEDPYIALVRFSNWHDYTELVFRKTGNTLKIAGWWN